MFSVVTLFLLRTAQLWTCLEDNSHKTSSPLCFEPHKIPPIFFSCSIMQENRISCSAVPLCCPISPPMLQCGDAGKGIWGFSIQAAPPSSIFQLLPWNPSPPALLAPSALPFPFFLPPLALLWAVTRLQKMLFQALLFHPYIEQELFPSYLCHPKWISLALPSVLYKQKHFGVKMEISHPLESLISSYTSFQARKNKVCLTLRTSPEHKSLFQGF